MESRLWLFEAQKKLENIGIKEAEQEAKVLFLEILSFPKNALLFSRLLSSKELKKLTDALQRRLEKEPLAYIVGNQPFFEDTFEVGEGVLVPRNDSESLILHIQEHVKLPKDAKILDLACGTGCLGLSLKRLYPHSRLTLSDLSPKALEYAKKNQKNLQLESKIICSDGFNHILGTFDLIITNPPYLDEGDSHLKALSFEPQEALIAKNEGLAYYQDWIPKAFEHLSPSGVLVLEHGHLQSNAVQKLTKNAGFKRITTFLDMGNRIRGLSAIKP